MSVLVTTTDGYQIFTSSGKQLRSLEGRRVESFTPGPGGTFLAVIDRHEIWSHGNDGEWTPLAKSEATLTAVVAAGDAVFVNVHVGGIPRSTDGGATWRPTVAVDDDVHQVLAHPSRPEIVVAAASVGLCRSRDGGATWSASTKGMDLTYARGV